MSEIFQVIGLDGFANKTALADTAHGTGASMIGVEDADLYYTGTNVETVLKEIYDKRNYQKVVVKTTDYTILLSDSAIVSNGATTITLPHATGSGITFHIKNVNTSSVILDANLSETIDGELNWTIYSNECLTVVDYATGKWAIL